MLNNFLFFDVDGTLRDFTMKGVPESAVQAIRKVQDNGSLVFIASGRPHFLLREDFGFQPDGFIFANGAGFEINGKVVLTRTFDNTFIQEFIKQAEACKVAYFLQCFDRGYVDKRFMENHVKMMEHFHSENERDKDYFRLGFNDMSLYRGDDVYKIDVLFYPDSDKDCFMKFLEGKVEIAETISMIDGVSGAELNKKDVTKGTGALMVVTHYHGNMDNTWAFGDSLNDLDIIKTVRHGVAMVNGHDKLKDYAEFVTDSPKDDGIYKALKHYQLI